MLGFGVEGFEEVFERAGESGLMSSQRVEKVVGGGGAAVLQDLAKRFGVVREALLAIGGFGEIFVGCRGLVWLGQGLLKLCGIGEEVALNVEVADRPGGAAQLAEELRGFSGGFGVFGGAGKAIRAERAEPRCGGWWSGPGGRRA